LQIGGAGWLAAGSDGATAAVVLSVRAGADGWATARARDTAAGLTDWPNKASASIRLNRRDNVAQVRARKKRAE
jgi:hypothetical protein